MTPEVKKRIEQIRYGIVPEGYKKSKIGIVPVEWQDTEFSSLFISYKISPVPASIRTTDFA